MPEGPTDNKFKDPIRLAVLPMSELPLPGARSKDRARPSLKNAHGLEPLHLEPPSKTKGLRPLGQIEGLEALAPTTSIFPEDDAPMRQEGDPRRKRIASTLDWDRLDDTRE